MRTKFIPLIIMLVASLAACIVTFINRYTVLDSLIIILVVLILFYIIGYIISKIAEKFLVVGAKTDIDNLEEFNNSNEINGEELDNKSTQETNEKSI